MLDDPTSFLTVEGQVLKDARDILEMSNEACPICEDADSFGEPCGPCMDDVSA